MRDPDRIDRILQKLRKIWKQYPDLRLGQIIENAKISQDPGMTDMFYIEDDVIERGIEEVYPEES